MFHIFHSAALQIFLVSCESASELMKPKPGTGETRWKSGRLGSVDFGEDGGSVSSMWNLLTLGLEEKGKEKGGETE